MLTTEQKSQFEEWVHRYTDDLLAWATHKTTALDIAEDLVQDTFLAAYSGLHTFEARSSPKTWLFSILNFKIIDYYRAKAKEQNSEDEISIRATQLTDQTFDEQGAWANQITNGLWEDETHLLDDPAFNQVMDICLDDLPPLWRTAITAKYLLQKKGSEISQELGISTANYWQIVHRSKLLLKTCIELKWPQ